MDQKFQKLISIWIYLLIKSMVLPNESFDVFHQALNQKFHKNGSEFKERFFWFCSLHLSPDASRFPEEQPSTWNFIVVETQSSS